MGEKKQRGFLRGSGVGPIWRGGRGEEKTEGIPLSVLDTSSQQCRNLLIVFLLVCLYVVAFCAGVTDEMLLRNEGQASIPFTGITFPLVDFYFAAPIIVLILHLNLLYNLYRHRKKLNGYKGDRNELYPFFANFSGEDKVAASQFLLTYFLIPATVLIYIQKTFLPYRHDWMTYLHQGTVLVDACCLFFYWKQSRSLHPSSRQTGGAYERFSQFGRIMFLVILTWTSLVVARQYEGEDPKLYIGIDIYHSVAQWENPIQHRSLNLYERSLLKYPEPEIVAALIDSRSGNIHENMINYIQGIDLQSRNLRYAFLRNTDLRRATLRAAQMQGADLMNAQMQRANLYLAKLHGAKLGNANMTNAHLHQAKLPEADLSDAKMQGTDLGYAEMQGAFLKDTQLQGASLKLAHMQGALLSGAQLQGALLIGTSMQGAELSNAKMDGACLSNTRIRGTTQLGLVVSASIISNLDYETNDAWDIQPMTITLINAKRRAEAGTPLEGRHLSEQKSDPAGYQQWRKSKACNSVFWAETLLAQEIYPLNRDHPCYIGLAKYLETTSECLPIVKELRLSEQGRTLFEAAR